MLRGGTLRWRDAMRGAPELALRDIRFALINDGRDHQIGLQAQPDGTVLHGPLDFRAAFAAPRSARPAMRSHGLARPTRRPARSTCAPRRTTCRCRSSSTRAASRVASGSISAAARLTQARGALSVARSHSNSRAAAPR
ncbi:MAG: hypothetical protein WDN30_06500 [Pararobbsia sp.]